MKNFKLTTESKINFFGKTVFRIEATSSFKTIKKGQKGGWAEKENNISGDAEIFGDARIFGDAWERSPLQIQGTKHFVSECKIGVLKIGCLEMSFDSWIEKFNSIGKKQGYSEHQIKEYELYIKLAISLRKLKL